MSDAEDALAVITANVADCVSTVQRVDYLNKVMDTLKERLSRYKSKQGNEYSEELVCATQELMQDVSELIMEQGHINDVCAMFTGLSYQDICSDMKAR